MFTIEKEAKWEASSTYAFRRFVSALRQIAVIESGPIYLSITDRYLDNEARIFSAQKAALRLRQTGKHFEATLKTRNQLVNGVARREEHTLPLPSAHSFVGALSQLKAQKNWQGYALENLHVRFILRNRRRIYTVRFGKCLCEAALDNYVICAASQTIKRREIELELKSGPEQLFLNLIEQLSYLSTLPRAKISKVATAEKILKNS